MKLDKNNNILSNICMNKRIQNEIFEIIKKYNINLIENDETLLININDNSYKFNKIVINKVIDEIQRIYFIKNNITITFLLNTYYPFQPPKKIYINEYEYIGLLKFSHKDLQHLGISKNNCLCCESLSNRY